MCLSVATPPPRDIGAESQATLDSQIRLAPEQYAAQAEFGPKYAQLDASNFKDVLGGVNGQPGLLDFYQNKVAPVLGQTQQTAQSGQRAADLADLQKYGASTVSAIKAANPAQANLLEGINKLAGNELAAGSGLTPDMKREAQQNVRSAQAARGLGFGPNDIFDEALTMGGRGQALKQQREGFATQVAGLDQASSVDPLLAVLGRPSTAVNPSLLNQGAASTAGANAAMFDPLNPYASDLYNTNYNAKAAADISSANNNAALYSSLISSGSKAASSA